MPGLSALNVSHLFTSSSCVWPESGALRQEFSPRYVGRDMANEFITNQLNDFQARIKGLRGSL